MNLALRERASPPESASSILHAIWGGQKPTFVINRRGGAVVWSGLGRVAEFQVDHFRRQACLVAELQKEDVRGYEPQLEAHGFVASLAARSFCIGHLRGWSSLNWRGV